MQRVKRRIFSGVVCEQEVYTVSDRTNIKKAEPRPRFKDDEERAQHRIGISKRKHQRLVNENFSPLSLYSTLTFDDDSEVHTFSEARRIRDNYFRRLQRACPDAKIIIYMGRGKSTNRIHFHMISDGIPEETISGKWNDGSVIHISKTWTKTSCRPSKALSRTRRSWRYPLKNCKRSSTKRDTPSNTKTAQIRAGRSKATR